MKTRWIACLLVVVSLGCRQESLPVTYLGELPGLRATHRTELREELARIESEKSTPAQLDQVHADTLQRGAWTEDPRLTEILSTKQAEFLVRRIDRTCPIDRFPMDPERSSEAQQIRRAFGDKRHELARLVSAPDFHFALSYQDGLLANLAFLEHAQAYFYLEALEVMNLHHLGQLNEAILPLAQMFLTIHRLDEKKHVASRLAAARHRATALRHVEALAQHPQSDEALQRRLVRLVDLQLERWPPDRDMWIGDRALGMHAYEVIRSGGFTSLLTDGELKQWAEQQRLARLVATVETNVDDDQLFYLMAMRELIAACERPYRERLATVEALEQQLDDLSDTANEPAFAARFLLDEIRSAMRVQTEDRARCEALAAALATALGEQPAYPVNPLTGEPYAMDVEAQRVVVWPLGKSGTESFVLPRTVLKKPASGRASLSG